MGNKSRAELLTSGPKERFTPDNSQNRRELLRGA
jgi:hypothetical protein